MVQGSQTTYLGSLRYGLEEMLKNDPAVYLLGEDISDPYGGAFNITKGLSILYPDKLLATPMSEQSFTGMGVGMALAGLKPIVEIMFGDFITLTLDQILNHASKFVEGFEKELHLVVRTPMGGYRGYGATHSQSIEKVYFGLPNINVIAPSVLHSPGELLINAVELGQPVLFIENKLDYTRKLFSAEKNSEYFDIRYYGNEFPICVTNLKNEPAELAIISYGGMVSPILKMIVDIYIEEEIPIKLIALSSVSPINFDHLKKLVSEDKTIITIEEGHIPFGFGDTVISQLCQRGISARFKTFGARNKIIGASKNIEDSILPNFSKIQEEILKIISIKI